MSNIVQFNPTQLPAFARTGALSETAKALAGGGGGQTGKRISIKGGVFRLIHNGKEVGAVEDRHLDVVMVKAALKVARIFYGKAYDSDNPTAPACWSSDGDKPDDDAHNRQASRCADCPQNVAGSGQNQSRACRYQHRVAVVLADEDNVQSDVMQIVFPATSIFGKAEGDNRPLQEYARWLAAQAISPEMVVTRMRFDTKVENPKLFFRPKRWLTPDQYAMVQELAETDDAKRAIALTVAKMDGVAAPAKLEGKPLTKAKPAPVEEVQEEEEAPPPPPKAKKTPKPKAEEVETDDTEEPTVRKDAPKAPQVGTKADLSQMVDAWDDE